MLDWKQIDTVFLDMDGTLLDLHYDNYFWLHHLPKRYAEIKDIPIHETELKLKNMYEQYRGTLDWYCIDFWQKELELDLMPLKQEVSDRIQYRPNARNFLQLLNESDLDVALVTNAHKMSIEIKLENTDLISFIPKIISSHDLQHPKEEQAFWERLQEEHPFDPKRTVFFDDNEDVLASAAQFGIAHLVTIAQPDSQQNRILSGKYTSLEDWADLPPINAQGNKA